MPTDLHQQIADELDLSPSDAEQVLHDLLRDVKDRAADGEDVALHDLGTFSTEDGALQFTPSPHLQTAVNHRNALFAPITVGAAQEAVSDEDDAVLVADTPPEEPATPDEGPPPDQNAFAPVEPLHAPADAPEDSTDEPDEPSADAETPTHVATMPPVEALDEVAPLSEEWTHELSEENAPVSTDRPTRTSSSSENASTAQVVGLTAAVAALALLIWFVLGTQGVVTGPDGLFQAASSPAPAGEDSAATTVAAPSEEETAPADSAEEERPAQPPTIDRDLGGWTIVVASRARPQPAENVLESYQQRFQGGDVPVDILTGTSGGQVRYRITIGQYAAREEALTALRTLQDQLPDDAWPLRIQPNS